MADQRRHRAASLVSRRENKKRQERLWKQVNDAVPPWPDIADIQVSQVVTRQSPRGEIIRGLLKLLGALLLVLAGYGMIKGDRELLFRLLDLVKYMLGPLTIWALGHLAASLRPRGITNDEESEDSG